VPTTAPAVVTTSAAPAVAGSPTPAVEQTAAGGPPEPLAVPRPVPRYGRPPSRAQLHAARRENRAGQYALVKLRHSSGHSLEQIAQETGLSPRTLRRWLRAGDLPADQRGYCGAGKIDAYIPYLRERLAAGCTNQTRLWREIAERGFTGTRSLVAKWLHTHGGQIAARLSAAPPALPGAKTVAWLVLRPAAEQTPSEQQLWQQLQHHTGLCEMGAAMRELGQLLRQRQVEGLAGWLQRAQNSSIAEWRNVATGLERDYAAVRAAFRLPWSTGPVEGQVHRLKLIKRTGYGRANFDLLRQRVLHRS